MNKLITQYNIYCDESSVDSDTIHPFFVIGALILPRIRKKEIQTKIKSNLKIRYELKWSKLSHLSLPDTKKIVDLFIQNKDVFYKAIVVNKNKIALKKYHNDDKELMFYKFYYLLLKNKLESEKKYYIFLDKKSVSVTNRVGVLKNFLNAFIMSNKQNCVIKHLQEYSSKENIFIQITDLFTGAVASRFNSKQLKSKPKSEFVDYLEEKLNYHIGKGTSIFEKKFNIFVWRPNKL